ncbi:hypothetical protein CAEBREN_20007 [Caenorhabditis brenneri]|uniref:DUF38 domain-containing protein n=1 Tax=Caenorhabditis brenneri TaxID=135651 RepID=G0N4E3_CAEBE|nr:hypothetical protein CAEBREN_20007 [Caenorhabditis brenneri]
MELNASRRTPTEFEYWNLLTPELKVECVKKMSLMEKIHLRSTSKTEKEVVSLVKFDLKQVSLSDTNYGPILEINVDDEEKFKLFAETEEIKEIQMVPLLVYLLKNGTIGDFVSREYTPYSEESWTKIQSCAPFRFKKISLELETNPEKREYLHKCVPELIKEVCFGAPFDDDSFNPLFEIESLKNVVKFQAGGNTNVVMRLAEEWIAKDKDIGNKMHFPCFVRKNELFDRFETHFSDKVVYRKDELRIETTNASKHLILLVVKKDGFVNTYALAALPSALRRQSQEYSEFIEDCKSIDGC